MNTVAISGKVLSIDLDTRDIVVLTSTPKGKEVKVIAHLWKAVGVDSDDAAHEGRSDWKNELEIDNEVTVYGHMGNNGRVIAGSLHINRPLSNFETLVESLTEGGIC